MRFLKRYFRILQLLRSLPAQLFKKYLLKVIVKKNKTKKQNSLYARTDLSARAGTGNWTHSLLSSGSEVISSRHTNTAFRRKEGSSSLEESSEKCLEGVLANEFVCGFHTISGAKGILRKGDKCKIKDMKWHCPVPGTTVDWVWLEHRLFPRADEVRTSSLKDRPRHYLEVARLYSLSASWILILKAPGHWKTWKSV